VWQVHRALPDVPLVGVGGIRTGADALEFLAAGASAVQVGTAIFNDPSAPMRIVHELAGELARRAIASPADVVGIAHR
jgi:dihydroorotate dehydrogenase (NAD+) catalytic subunit